MRVVGKQTGIILLSGALSLLPAGKSVAQKASTVAGKSLHSSEVLVNSAKHLKGVTTDVVESGTFDAAKILDKYKWTSSEQQDVKIPFLAKVKAKNPEVKIPYRLDVDESSKIAAKDSVKSNNLDSKKIFDEIKWPSYDKPDVKIHSSQKAQKPEVDPPYIA